MGYKFSKKSNDKLNTCHEDLQLIMREVISIYDFSILEGTRSTAKQQEYYKKGLSKLDGVRRKSKHQSYPSLAVDIMPWKKGTNAFSGKTADTNRFIFLAGIIKAVSERLYNEAKITHKIRWGGDWDNDDLMSDHKFLDFPHFELRKI